MPEPDATDTAGKAPGHDRFADVPVEISIHVGTARPLIRDLMELEEDVVLTLDRTIDDPVELCIGDRLIARGELQEIGEEGSGRLGVRVTEIVTQDTGSA
jgi:flagellar motor switch protein FliN/FliY